MGDRKKVGIIYEYNENWIGGSYYIQNLISAINCISDALKPVLYIYTEDNNHFEQLKSTTQYPYLRKGNYFTKRNIFQKVINKLCLKLLKIDLYSRFSKEVEIVFPATNESKFSGAQKFIYWIPDFQEHYLPAFFTKEDVELRKAYQKSLLDKACDIIFSSLAAQDDFNNIYPGAVIKQYVLPFAVTHPDLESAQDCLSIYKINVPYFICCNQFWKHKNHKVIFEAIHILKGKGEQIHVVFTGKEHDFRNPTYFKELLDYVEHLNIKDNTSFLGFINRKDQLTLTKTSLAVLQPSLFEGWSTVIEDAKSLKVKIVASDIKVHREQLKSYPTCLYFDPVSSNELAEKMMAVKEGDLDIGNDHNYNIAIKQFGNDFVEIVNSLK